jgi:hypothetical protein
MTADWLTDLKAGDEVGVERGGASSEVTLTTVLRRTPTGQVVVNWGRGERRFRPDGREEGGDVWYITRLVQVTDELRTRIEHARLAAQLSSVRWSGLPVEVLRRVKEVVEEQG